MVADQLKGKVQNFVDNIINPDQQAAADERRRNPSIEEVKMQIGRMGQHPGLNAAPDGYKDPAYVDLAQTINAAKAANTVSSTIFKGIQKDIAQQQSALQEEKKSAE